MKTLLFVILVSLAQIVVEAQDTALLNRITKLSNVKNIPFDDCNKLYKDCGDELIWQIVKFGKPAIMPLIDKISDTSYSTVRFKDDDKVITLRTGDIAYICLTQIVFVPVAVISKMQFDVVLCGGYQAYFFTYLSNYSTRLKFQNQLKDYYSKTILKWEKDNKSFLEECKRKHGIFGHYHN
ncbi:MAG: hypothetical protein JST86_11515 [Bacteroidetes bacterium]|nr:hypothetical protein [Bacteroidota bacterium]